MASLLQKSVCTVNKELNTSVLPRYCTSTMCSHTNTSQLRGPVRERAALAEAARAARREVGAELGLPLDLALHAVCARHGLRRRVLLCV